MAKKIYIADFETSTGNSDGSTNVYLWALSDLDKSERYIDVNIESFMYCLEYNEIDTLYFHNLGWDGMFIVHHLIDKGYKFVDTPFEDPELPYSFSYMKETSGRIYDLQIRIGNKLVCIKDTLVLLNESVDAMGESLGLPKLTEQMDYDKYKYFNNIDEVPEDVVEYIWRDIDIVIEMFSNFKSKFKNHGVTISSSAVKDFKKHYGEKEYNKKFGGYYYNPKTRQRETHNVLTTEQWDFVKRSYRGGLVIFQENYKNKLLKNIDGYSVDVNSLYPHAYKDYRHPVGKPYYHEIKDDMLKLHRIFIKRAKKKWDNIPAFIPSNYSKSSFDTKYLDYVENEYYVIWEWELDIWKEGYHIDYRIVDTLYFEGEFSFTSWAEAKSHLKEHAETDVERDTAKKFLNGFYGKWGQNRTRKNKKIVFDPNHELVGARIGKDGLYCEIVETTHDDLLSYIPVASSITSRARTVLLKAVLANRGRVIYCDTDSMYCSSKPVGIEIHDTKFGAWKYEKHFDRFKFIKPKCYIANVLEEYSKIKVNGKIIGYEWKPKNKISRTIAGLTKENHHKITFENFHKGSVIEGGKRQKKNVKGGLVLVDINYTI